MSEENNDIDTNYLQHFKKLSNNSQLKILQDLLLNSSPEVKYGFALNVEDITKYDVITELPVEIVEKIFTYIDLPSLLKCRQVSRSWTDRINYCDVVWLPHLRRHCIDVNGFQSYDECWRRSKKHKPVPSAGQEDLNIIGERLFNFDTSLIDNPNKKCNCTETPSKSYAFVMGKKLLLSLKKQAGFEHIVDHDCCGSNVVMAMNSNIIAYARGEDRHIVVKYTNFPHKKISVFEAHQCADIKIHGDELITGGYDRTICIWKWETGSLVRCLQGSVKPVYSLDVCRDILVSSDGSSILTWDLKSYKMRVKSICFDDGGNVEELKIIDPTLSVRLKEIYADDTLLVVVRSNKAVKIGMCDKNGKINFHNPNLEINRQVNNFQPFIQIYNDKLACSSDFGILVWSLVDFTLIKSIERHPCLECQYNFRTGLFPHASNCRVILLYYSDVLLLQYFVHLNQFQLFGTRRDSNVEIAWNFPSDEKWPWSHRKPGLASLVLDMKNGFSMNTKITMFVATQGKKIYGMLFDASDLNYGTESQLSNCGTVHSPLLTESL